MDERRFTEVVEPGFKIKPRPVLLHVGQFIGRKGIDLLLRAAAAVQREGHEFSLLLVGSGRDKDELETLAKELQLRNVHFEQGRDPLQMPATYRSADVLMFPTLEDVWGLVANEAVLCGLPVLCSKYAGCANEIFTTESIFDPMDTSDFVNKLRDSVAGKLPKPNRSRLRTTSEIVDRMAHAIAASTGPEAESGRLAAESRSG